MSDNVATLIPRTLGSRERDNYDFLIDWSLQLQGVDDYGELCRHVLRAVGQRTRYQAVWMYVRRPLAPERWLMISCADEAEANTDDNFPELEVVNDDFLRALTRSREPVVIEDARLDPDTDKEMVRLLRSRTIIHVPVAVQGRTTAILGIGSFGDQGVIPPQPVELQFLTVVANHVGAVKMRIDERIHREERETELEQSRRQAEAASRARSEFLSRMCLQLRTPLGTIRSIARLMNFELEQYSVPDPRLQQITRDAEHLLRITAEMLALSNGEGDGSSPQPGDPGIGSIIDAAISGVAEEDLSG